MRIGKIFRGLEWCHASNTNVGGSSSHVGKNVGRLDVVRQSNIDRDTPNKMKHEGLDGAITSAVEVSNETLHKVLIAQKDATEAHHVKIVCPVLTILKE